MSINVFNATISSTGILDLSPGSGIYNVETFAGALTDTIEEVTGMVSGEAYVLRVKTVGHYWTINHDPAKKIRLSNGLGFATRNPDDHIALHASDAGTYVFQVGGGFPVPAT